MTRMSKKNFKKNFPNLYREIESPGGGMKVKVDKGKGYDPSVMDFLGWCSTDDQAVEIIDYLEKRGEITALYADSLRKQVREKGVRSLVGKREPGYYFKEFG